MMPHPMNRPCRQTALILLIVFSVPLCLILTTAAHAAETWVLEVQAGKYDRLQTPLSVDAPQQTDPQRKWTLTRCDRSEQILVQQVGGRLYWILAEKLPAGESRRYQLESSAQVDQPAVPQAVCEDDGSSLWVKVAGKPVLRYRHQTVEPPAGMPAYYRRSGYIHPLFGPNGKEISGDFAADHAHQHGQFMAWVKSTWNGQPIDFWNQAKQEGQVKHQQIIDTFSGPVAAGFEVTLQHSALDKQQQATPVLDETWRVRGYALSNVYVIDWESVQTCASEIPLTIEEYHYGGWGLRGNSQWLASDKKTADGKKPPIPGEFLTSEGLGRLEGNHTRPRWVSLSGQIDGEWTGVAVMDHRENFRFPQPVRLHPAKPYFCFAPMVDGAFDIKPGEPYRSRYRLLLHTGRPDTAAIEQAWHDYADPPLVSLTNCP